MATADLPPELWLEILSYFPSSFVIKLVGVNRFLFELALAYKYEELQLLSCDKSALNNFQQLHYENVASRVRSLLIRPDFLTPFDSKVPTLSRRKRSSRWLKKLISSHDDDPSQAPPQGEGLVSKTLKSATKDLTKCRNLQEVKIIVNDYIITDTFQRFLANLWGALGGNLQKLSIQTTHPTVPLLLGSVVEHHAKLPNVSSFDLTLMHSRQPMKEGDPEQTIKTIVQFLESFKTPLSSFAFSSLIACDLSPLFEKVEVLPNLKKLDLLFIMCGVTLSSRASLANFLARQQHTLEHLVLGPRPRYEFFFPHESELHLFLTQELKVVHLPMVTTFHVREPTLPPTLVPEIMPNLRHLIVDNDGDINEEKLRSILDATGGMLEALDICIADLTVSMLDMLAKDSPKLQRLTVSSYLHWGMRTDFGKWGEQVSARRYPNWPLDYVRMGQRGSCGEIHPRLWMMDAVGQTVRPRTVVRDAEHRCFCYRGE